MRRLAVGGSSGFAVLVLTAILAAIWGLWIFNSPGPAAKEGGQTVVVLRRGAHLPEIAAALEDGGAVRSASVFAAAAQVTGAARHLKAGEYAFPSHASIGQVLDRITHGRIVHHPVTIPEGVTSQMAVDILMSKPELTGSVPTPPEGSLMPETYEVVRGEERSTVLKRMMDARDRELADLWKNRKPGLPFNTPDEAVTLASIVEKETALASERPRIAAVFINRLRAGMKLESDPTIIYGLTGGRPLGHGIRQSELDQPNPYSTYQITGLPPGPICNPSRAALAAVLDPPDTQELYFVADGTGGHAFSTTLEEHSKNVAHLRELEAAAREARTKATAEAASSETAAAAGEVAGPPPQSATKR